jgi:outer membrane protein assembly factor BamB
LNKGSPLDIFDRRAAIFLAVLSGLVSVAVIAGLAYHGLARRYPAYIEAEPLPSQRKALQKVPDQPDIKDAYRAEDLRRRRAFFRSQSKLATGGFLLIGALFVFALSMRRLAQLTERLPVPAKPRPRRKLGRERKLATGWAAGVSAAAAAAVLAVLLMVRLMPTGAGDGPGIDVASGPDETDVPESQRWPAFRGPGGMGVAAAGDYPLKWDAATGENIVWKTKTPLPGYSSPVVWGKHVLATGADLRRRKLFCFDRSNGILEWECTIITRVRLPERFKVPEDTGLAAPTPATDGRRVYVFYGTNELAAVDLAGRLVWAKWLGEPDHPYGVSTSPILHEHEGKTRVILQHDQSEKSFLYAFDAATGAEVWKKKRELPGSWATPIVVVAGGRKELITCGVPWVISYNPVTGEELWRADVLDGDIAPSPVYADGMVYTVTDHAQLAAIRTGGKGDVTETRVAWTYDEELPDASSPVTDGRLYIHATSAGFVICLDAKTGKEVWTKRFKRRMFWSSTTLVGGRVYVADAKGVTSVFPLAREFKLAGTGAVGERVYATPAFVEGRIYMRGKEHLFCIGKQAGRVPPGGPAETRQPSPEGSGVAEREVF